MGYKSAPFAIETCEHPASKTSWVLADGKNASTWKLYATERCDFFSSRITWTISNHDKSMIKHAHDSFDGNGKSTSQKRWLLLRTRVCCAHDFKTLNMVAFSHMWFILFYFTIVGFIFPYIMAVFRHVCGPLDIWQPNFTYGKKKAVFDMCMSMCVRYLTREN